MIDKYIDYGILDMFIIYHVIKSSFINILDDFILNIKLE